MKKVSMMDNLDSLVASYREGMQGTAAPVVTPDDLFTLEKAADLLRDAAQALQDLHNSTQRTTGRGYRFCKNDLAAILAARSVLCELRGEIVS
jgi:hypothetical protein